VCLDELPMPLNSFLIFFMSVAMHDDLTELGPSSVALGDGARQPAS